jgi:8-oxo-dGTP pyrophosphatase MutT (NUDIX family)/phosphohistidine phosphatase SixA
VPSDPAPVLAAGGLLWRPRGSAGTEVALVHRPRYKDWSLPKGKAARGETPPVTAQREVLEETGYRAVIGRRLTTVRYKVAAGPKLVDYFAARALEGNFTPNREVDRMRWLTPDQARALMTYDFDRAVLDTFERQPISVNSVVLVRHARAGVREAWSGPDSARPLDAKGRKQAAALARELVPFCPAAVLSAPVERCRETVAGLAKDLGLTVQLEAALGEEAYRENPAGARRLLSQLGAAGTPVVVCSQGGVIPGVIKSLASRADLKIGSTSTPKSASWVLSFDGPTLVQADPYPAPSVS